MALASLHSVLPPPTHVRDREDEELLRKAPTTIVPLKKSFAPPYGKREGWVPRSEEDFGDGGAFPEIHCAQYPLGMGKKKNSSETKSNSLAIQLDAQGKIKYDAIARQGHSKDKIVYASFKDLIPKEIRDDDDPSIRRPDDEEVQKTTEKTRLALEKLTRSKISAAMPVRCADKKEPAQFIRYTPSQQGNQFNSGAKQRVIKMVEVQRDPMSPPRFKINTKIPRAPPSPPAPVLHSPIRKVTVKEQKEWKIPPCVSNWKNTKGYTIPLDKRMAADGRGLQQVHINENFAKLAEGLYIADRKAREQIETRAQMEKKVAQKMKEQQESKLRDLARKAREQRNRVGGEAGDGEEDAKERDQLRYDRHKERQRERNIARAAPDKRNRLERERERDISEQIALGLPAKTVTTGEGQFDSRLFNQSRGMDSGFADDEAYNVYDKPWRQANELAQGIYRPKKGAESEFSEEDFNNLKNTSRFVPDREFSGTDRTASRSGPVQFEKEEDPFGLDQFLQQAKRDTKRPSDDKPSSSSSEKRRRRD